MGDLLQPRNLRVSFGADDVLKGLDLDIDPGEALALTGPSGAGKSVTARALLGLLPVSASWSGSILWKGQPLSDPAGSAWHEVRGAGMTLVLQEPMAALDPVQSSLSQGLPDPSESLVLVERARKGDQQALERLLERMVVHHARRAGRRAEHGAERAD